MFSHKQDSHFQAVPVKEKREKAQKGNLACIQPPALPQRLKRPAEQPILHQRLQSPTLWSPRVPSSNPNHPSPSAQPCGDRAAVGVDHRGNCRVYYHGDGLQSIVLENLKCQFIPRHVHKLARVKATEHLPLQTLTMENRPPALPILSEAPPPHPLLLMPGRHRLD